MRKVIQELLDSSISTSAISQGAGVPWTTVSDLRKGKTSMDKMALLTAEKLLRYLFQGAAGTFLPSNVFR